METTKITRTFKNGNSQAVRIPSEFKLPDGDVIIEKIGGAILLIPKNDPWRLFDESLNGFSDDFLASGRSQPEMQKRSVAFDK
ncbi:MAG: type II toxin-antitoxin system VapB family antitoxin [Synergistaceae bacterium]|nr:type II toxin-antitoxin system VapB family antitoxin [Synergistaceae bacterium]